MSKASACILSFITGGIAAGSAVYIYHRKKMKELTEKFSEDVSKFEQSVMSIPKETAPSTGTDIPDESNKETQKEKPETIQEYYNKIVEENGYSSIEQTKKRKKNPISYISAEEYGKNNNYAQISLSYYTDGVVTDETGEPLYNPEEVLGNGFEDALDTCDVGVAYVRNDTMKTYFDISIIDNDYS